jgi:hypothetical protein
MTTQLARIMEVTVTLPDRMMNTLRFLVRLCRCVLRGPLSPEAFFVLELSVAKTISEIRYD